jgi:hypothetical protein
MNTPKKSMIGGRRGARMLTAITLAATTIIWAAAPKVRGDSGWTDWQSLGRLVASPVPNEPFRLATAAFRNGNPVIATVDRTGMWLTVIEERQGFWSPWYHLYWATANFPSITMTSNANTQPILFYRGLDSVVWFTEVTAPGTGAHGATRWTSYESLGRPADAFPNLVYATRLSDRRVAVCFTDGSTSTIRCRIRQADGAWGPWISSGRAPGAIGLALTARFDAEHRIHFFAASADTLFELPQGGRGVLGGAWSTIGRITGLRLAAPMVAANADGRLEVFARGSDNALWHIYQQPGASTWSSWESLGRPPGVALPFGFATDAVAENDDQRLEVFVVAGDAAVWHIYQTRPNCCWSEWESLGHPRSDWKLLTELRVVRRRSHSLELFTLDHQGTLWTTYQQ